MPSSQVIVAGLAQIANRAFAFAVAVHVVLGLLAIAIALGARPTWRVGLALVSLLLASVSAVALLFGNPFNGGVFALLAAAYAGAALRWRDAPERLKYAPFVRGIGWVLLVFGWTYPHFLDQSSPFAYLIGAPLGLVPCPTLAFTLGLTLTGLVPAAAPLSLTLGASALFYGLFGMLRLGVMLDGVLLFGGLVLLFLQLRFWRPRSLSAS
jgi:hypothetical protein